MSASAESGLHGLKSFPAKRPAEVALPSEELECNGSAVQLVAPKLVGRG